MRHANGSGRKPCLACGVAHWAGVDDVNGRSVGIEIQNPGHEFGYHAFPDVQIRAVIKMCSDVLSRYDIPAQNVLAHSDVAPTRKEDPGELFPWRDLAESGIGLWPRASAADTASHARLVPGESGILVERMQVDLAAIGYGLHVTGQYDAGTQAVVTAFQRHFVQDRITGIADGCTLAKIQALLQMI